MYETLTHSAHDTARWFRQVLRALSRPGLTVAVAPPPESVKALTPAALTVLLTLADFHTPVWLGPELDDEAVKRFLAFHTGAPVVHESRNAIFAVLQACDALAVLPALSRGTQHYPDRAATLIIQSSGFANGDSVTFEGPGVESRVTVQVEDLDLDFWRHLSFVNSAFPLGIDVLIASPKELIGVPRSTRILQGRT